MQKSPKPVFISKHDRASPATMRATSCLETAADPALNPERVSGQVNNTLARKTARLVETHPEDAVRVLRGWLCQD